MCMCPCGDVSSVMPVWMGLNFDITFQMALLSPQVLKTIACDKAAFAKLIVPSPPYNITPSQMVNSLSLNFFVGEKKGVGG